MNPIVQCSLLGSMGLIIVWGGNSNIKTYVKPTPRSQAALLLDNKTLKRSLAGLLSVVLIGKIASNIQCCNW